MITLPIELRAREEKTSASSGKEKLLTLAHELRHPEDWPTDFKWNYADCRTCAVGLATELGYVSNLVFSGDRMTSDNWDSLAKQFDISGEDVRAIFCGSYGTTLDKITPEIVAAAIDEHLIETEVSSIQGA